MNGTATPHDAHVPAAALDAYRRGALSPAGAAAVELHAQDCPHCRFAVNERVLAADPARAERNLVAVAAVLDAPRHGVIERGLVRIGMPTEVVRMMVATPALRRSWFIAIGVALLFGISAAGPNRPDSTILWFLALAPLIPVIGVALAYGPGVDPSYEITLATPVSGFRLVLIRAVAVLATSIAITGLISLLLVERHAAMIGAWIAPALALSCVCLALMTLVRPGVAAAIVASGWLAVTIGVSGASDQLVLFRAPAQVAFVALAAIGAAVIGARRRTFDLARGDAIS